MDPSFWHERWSENRIGFHEGAPNALLTAHAHRLALGKGSRVFLPLCGKTRDIGWWLSQGCRVAGAELSEKAVGELFDDLGLEPRVTQVGALHRYSFEDIDIFVGDIFDLTVEQLGPVDAVYDRAALVALPEDIRPRYARHLTRLTGAAPQLLITFDYDQSVMDGPPFSISDEMLTAYYSDTYTRTLLERADVAGGLKGQAKADEMAWLLHA